jgi:hypothetical protein
MTKLLASKAAEAMPPLPPDPSVAKPAAK